MAGVCYTTLRNYLSNANMAAAESTFDKNDDRPVHDPPYGMEPYDLPGVFDSLGALSDVQQKELCKYKDLARKEDEQYLREHPEIACMVKDFVSELLKHRPSDMDKFASDYFTHTQLRDKVTALLEEYASNRKINFILRNSFIEIPKNLV